MCIAVKDIFFRETIKKHRHTNDSRYLPISGRFTRNWLVLTRRHSTVVYRIRECSLARLRTFDQFLMRLLDRWSAPIAPQPLFPPGLLPCRPDVFLIR